MLNLIAGMCQSALDGLGRLAWLAPLLMRLFFGYFWAETGWAKLHNLDGATQRFIDWGIPYPEFSAAFSASAEFIGGVLLMLGLFTRLISIALIINMIVAIFTVAITKVTGLDEFIELDEFVYILILFWLLMAGPGTVSVDTLINRWLGITAHPPE